jgi:hypothetical protein
MAAMVAFSTTTKLNVVDSSAWLSYFAGDANAKTFSKPIEDIANSSSLALPSPKYLK